MSDLNQKLAPNFTLREFVEQDLHAWNAIDLDTQAMFILRLTAVAQGWQKVRDKIGAPIIINSGWRSWQRNSRIGGSPTSDHPRGWAGDGATRAMSAISLFAVIRDMAQAGEIKFDQLIGYMGHVHIGMNPRMRGHVFTKR